VSGDASDGDDPAFRAVLEATAEGVVVFDDDGRVTYANGQFGRLVGRTAGELPGTDAGELFGLPAADRARDRGDDGAPVDPSTSVDRPTVQVEDVWGSLDERATSAGHGVDELETLADESPRAVPAVVRRPDGSTVPVGVTRRDLDRQDPPRSVATVRDRRAERDREREREAYERRFRTVFEASNDGIVLFDPVEGRIEEANPQACELFGYARGELLAMDPAEIHPHDVDRFRAFVESVLSHGSGWTDELSCYTCEGRTLPAEISASVVELDDRRLVLASIRDVSERREREASLRRRSAAMAAATDGIAVLDTDGAFRYANRAYARQYGYEDPATLVGRSWRTGYDEREADRLAEAALGSVRETGRWRGEAVATGTDGSTFPQELSLTALDDGGTVCIVRDVSDRAAQEATLEALAAADRELLRAGSVRAVAETSVEAAVEVLGHGVACVRLFDPETNRLEPVAHTDEAARLLTDRTAYDLEATHAGRALRTGETVRTGPSADPRPPSDAEFGLHVPIGDRGVLTVVATGHDRSGLGSGDGDGTGTADPVPEGSDADGGFDERTVRLTEVLAGDVAAALDRTEREADLRASEAAVRDQRDQLATLEAVNALVREVVASLVEAPTREEVETVVTERLATSALFRGAWLAGVAADGSTLTPRVLAGDPGGRLATATVERGPIPLEAIDGGELARAIDTGAVQTVHRYEVADPDPSSTAGVTDTAAGPDERPETAVHTGDSGSAGRVEAVAAVPIVRGERVDGVLVVVADRVDVFGERARDGLALLGEAVGFALEAVRRRGLLLSDTGVELEYRLDASVSYFAAASRELRCRCVREDSTPLADGRVRHLLRIEGADPAAVAALVADAEPVLEADTVRGDGDDAGGYVSVVVDGSPPELLVENGATIERLVAEDGVSTLVAGAPRDVDARAVTLALEEQYPGIEFVARRERPATPRGAGTYRGAVADRLTDRQREVAQTAFEAGYFEWPRDRTAREVAELLEISPPTLHQHLRKAEHALLAAFLGVEDA
jgi:PAS domain S-box-containing protein